MSTYSERDADRYILLESLDGGTTWTPVNSPAGGTGSLTDVQLRATPVPVSGTLAVTESGTWTVALDAATLAALESITVVDGGGSLTVDGTFWQATQPVSLASVPSHAVTNAGTFAVQADTELPAAAALGDTDGNPTTPTVGAANMAWNGSSWNRAKATAVGDGQTNGILGAGAYLYNGTNMDRARAGTVTGSFKTDEARPASATKASVADAASSTTLLAANTSRKGASFYNDSTSILYIDFTGGTASATSFSVKVPPDGYVELPQPCMTNLITGIWSADASGSARVTEW